MRKLIILFSFLILMACNNNEVTDSEGKNNNVTETDEVENKEEDMVDDEEIVELTVQQKMIQNILDLIDEGLAFDTGSYIPGDIPKGEYALIGLSEGSSYYSEKELNGNIIDNENFDSFGYVYVHEVGNIETRGVLVKVDALSKLGVSGAKELYEIMNNLTDYKESGWYKVGVDIEPGEYIIESYGSGYVAIMSGPVGKSDIIDNENFNGRYSVNVKDGQYLIISRGYIAE